MQGVVGSNPTASTRDSPTGTIAFSLFTRRAVIPCRRSPNLSTNLRSADCCAALLFTIDYDLDAAGAGEFGDVVRALVAEQDQDDALTLVRVVIVIRAHEAPALHQRGCVNVGCLLCSGNQVNRVGGVRESGPSVRGISMLARDPDSGAVPPASRISVGADSEPPAVSGLAFAETVEGRRPERCGGGNSTWRA